MASLRLSVLVRNLSTSASISQMVKPPIQVFGMEGRYAMALYSAASKKKALNEVERDLKEISGLMKTDVIFCDFMKNPLLSRDLKKTAIESVCTKKKANVLTANLLGLLTENGRIKDLVGVAQAFATIMAAERGEVVCEVTTAKEVDAATRKEIEAVLKTFVMKGETILLNMKVDPAIIGGMLVSIGDKYVDMSMATKISKYTSLIQASV